MKKLIYLVAATIFLAANSACSNSSVKSEQTASSEVQVKETKGTLTVQGACEMCKKRIEKTATSVEGVSSATWNSETKNLEFAYDAEKTTPEAVSKALAKVGHDTDKDKAPDDIYNALPGCCKYRG
jgi:Cu(I)/Ag(I) efflux system membrane fusion protein